MASESFVYSIKKQAYEKESKKRLEKVCTAVIIRRIVLFLNAIQSHQMGFECFSGFHEFKNNNKEIICVLVWKSDYLLLHLFGVIGS